MKDGHYYNYWDNGIIKSVGNYKDGNKIDTWFYFNEFGKLIKEVGYMILKGEKNSFIYYSKEN